MSYRPDRDQTRHLIAVLTRIRAGALALERRHGTDIERVHPEARVSARNLLHYLSIRQEDLNEVQPMLAKLGLSSLGRTEAHALAGVEAVLRTLHALTGRDMPDWPDPPVDYDSGYARLSDGTERLLGPRPGHQQARIMVTMPTQAATDYRFVRDLLAAGMNVMRINSAHDDRTAWTAMARNLTRAKNELGRSCRILFDLGGPKLRTGRMATGAHLTRWRPQRDVRGIPVSPARVRIVPAKGEEAEEAEVAHETRRDPRLDMVTLPIAGDIANKARVGDVIRLIDTRDRKRKLRVVEAGDHGCVAETERGGRAESGAAVRLCREDEVIAEGKVGALPLVEEPPVVRVGDPLLVTIEDVPGGPAVCDEQGRILEPARIPCTLAAVFRDVRPGETIWFDDGKLGGKIEVVGDEGIRIRVSHAPPTGAKLCSDKGINLPDTELHVPGLTDKDLLDLDFAVEHADMVGLSFVERPADVHRLVDELALRNGTRLGIVLKIETRRAFREFPRLILAGLRSPPLGVMVARGDLAVEVGYARLAEVQEELLWLCEAAHVPVIWATDVLEGLAKRGRPSRAEVTDAAMSGRAECVMLNKGPHITETVTLLKEILRRMQRHLFKKRALLGRLSVSEIDQL